jgi:hypothetical protein
MKNNALLEKIESPFSCRYEKWKRAECKISASIIAPIIIIQIS